MRVWISKQWMEKITLWKEGEQEKFMNVSMLLLRLTWRVSEVSFSIP